jgi:hypothetical protein
VRETREQYNLRRGREVLAQYEWHVSELEALTAERPLTHKELFDLNEFREAVTDMKQTIIVQEESL